MKFNIQHTTEYTYSGPVFLEPHTLKLMPRSNGSQRLLDFKVTFDPEPIGFTSSEDLSGNDTLNLWFRGMHDHLKIITTCQVETLRKNPYDFIITDNRAAEVPVRYGRSFKDTMIPYTKNYEEISNVVRNYVSEVLEESGTETLSFLSGMCASIRRDFEHIHRPEGNPVDPRETLHLRKGACRDLTALFMEAVQSQGFAARFVSGYKEDEEFEGERQLHAWAEVYLPGGGWRGYDPTTGLMVSDSHIALASGAEAIDASPVTGSYRGDNISSELKFLIDISSEKTTD